MRKRSTRKPRPIGHVLTPHQVGQLTLPIHMALELLALGLFGDTHAEDLCAFLSIAQIAAENADRPDMVEIGAAGALVVIDMRNRVRAGEKWFASREELAILNRTVAIIDRFIRTQSTTRMSEALEAAHASAWAARQAGAGSLDFVGENQCQ